MKLSWDAYLRKTGVDREGYPARDDGGASYVGAIEPADVFGRRIYAEAMRRGMGSAGEVCVVGDGAAKDLEYRGRAILWSHPDHRSLSCAGALLERSQGLSACGPACAPVCVQRTGRPASDGIRKSCVNGRRRVNRNKDDGRPEDVIAAIIRCSSLPGSDQEVCEKEAGYFERNKERMRYADFRARELFVGSGVLGAGCRTVVAQRLKQSGMHWTVQGANSIIALRCSILSNRWANFWEYRAAA